MFVKPLFVKSTLFAIINPKQKGWYLQILFLAWSSFTQDEILQHAARWILHIDGPKGVRWKFVIGLMQLTVTTRLLRIHKRWHYNLIRVIFPPLPPTIVKGVSKLVEFTYLGEEVKLRRVVYYNNYRRQFWPSPHHRGIAVSIESMDRHYLEPKDMKLRDIRAEIKKFIKVSKEMSEVTIFPDIPDKRSM